MTIRKAIIPAAGLGTRLLPSTKELPKEMLPIYTKSKDGSLTIKPLLQTIFEILYDTGLREFCFIIGRGKRAIEDHFTPDFSYLSLLEERGKNKKAEELRSFYEKIQKLNSHMGIKPGSDGIWLDIDNPESYWKALKLSYEMVKKELPYPE